MDISAQHYAIVETLYKAIQKDNFDSFTLGLKEARRRHVDLDKLVQGESLMGAIVNFGVDVAFMQALKDAGGNLDVRNGKGLTPLMEACLPVRRGDYYKAGRPEHGKWLLKNRCDVDARDPAGNNAGHFAAQLDIAFSGESLLRAFALHGGDVNAVNEEDLTPWEIVGDVFGTNYVSRFSNTIELGVDRSQHRYKRSLKESSDFYIDKKNPGNSRGHCDMHHSENSYEHFMPKEHLALDELLDRQRNATTKLLQLAGAGKLGHTFDRRDFTDAEALQIYNALPETFRRQHSGKVRFIIEQIEKGGIESWLNPDGTAAHIGELVEFAPALFRCRELRSSLFAPGYEANALHLYNALPAEERQKYVQDITPFVTAVKGAYHQRRRDGTLSHAEAETIRRAGYLAMNEAMQETAAEVFGIG